MPRRLYSLVLVVALMSIVAPASARADAERVWVRPVAGAVVRPFDPPQSRFGAGHLGVDLRAPRGTPVRAAGPGVVTWEGSIAGALHVVIAHAGNLRTSYSFLATVSVRRGDRVQGGDVVGTSGGVGEGHDGSVVHLGLRSGTTYVDPMQLFEPVDLATVVHLAPTTDPPRPTSTASERRGLVDGLAHDVGVVVHGAGVVVHAAATGIVTAGRAAIGASRTFGEAFARSNPLALAVAKATVAALQEQLSCDPHAPPADGDGGSGHRVMLVAGIESSLDATHPALNLPTAELGYQAGEVSTFSYAPDGGDYTAADTEGPIMDAARRLGNQLRALQRDDPGREVDLLAHSQGGVVVEAFLTQVYKRDDQSYPPLGTVVTLSSPLRGDPLASSGADLASTTPGELLLGEVEQLTGLPLLTPAARDLAAGSALMRKLDAARLPDEVQLTTIGAATDVVVPGNVATRPGAQHTTVATRGVNAHTAIVSDPAAMQAVRAALEDRPLPCPSLAAAVVGTVVPITISTLEEQAGRLGRLLAGPADGKI